MPQHKKKFSTSIVKDISKMRTRSNRIDTQSEQMDIADNQELKNESNNIPFTVKNEPEKLAENCNPAEQFDLNRFKFEKKPHIKIEYEEQSSTKEDNRGLWEPANWRQFLQNLEIMRTNINAPVDTMGCDKCMDPNASPEVFRYQSLIALMLSSQTKDQVTYAAMERLRARGLTVDNILHMSDNELEKLLYPVSFYKNKAKYIKKTSQTLKEQYNSDIPDTVEKLCKLTGVGPKMAHICMSVAWNKITGIAVDTHVHRISNRIHWVKKPTKSPEDTRKALESWIPYDQWSKVNNLMVGFGQTICLPVAPQCDECLNRDICPYTGKVKKSPSKYASPVKSEKNDDENTEKSPMDITRSHPKRKPVVKPELHAEHDNLKDAEIVDAKKSAVEQKSVAVKNLNQNKEDSKLGVAVKKIKLTKK